MKSPTSDRRYVQSFTDSLHAVVLLLPLGGMLVHCKVTQTFFFFGLLPFIHLGRDNNVELSFLASVTT